MLTRQREGEPLSVYAKRVEKIFEVNVKCLDVCLFEHFLDGVRPNIDSFLLVDLLEIVKEIRKKPIITQKPDESVLDFVARVDHLFTCLDSVCSKCFIITVIAGLNQVNQVRNPKIICGFPRDLFYEFIFKRQLDDEYPNILESRDREQ